MYSLRNRLLIGMIVCTFLLLTCFSFTLYSIISGAMVEQFDSSLLSTAHMLAAAAEDDEGRLEFEMDMSMIAEFQNPKGPAYYQMWKQGRVVVARSVSLGSEDIEYFEGRMNEPVYKEQRSIDARSGRSVSYKFKPRGGSEDKEHDEHGDERHDADSDREGSSKEKLRQSEAILTVVVLRDDSELRANLMFLRLLLIIASAVTIVISVFVVGFVVHQGLRPVNILADQIAGVKEDDLTVRIDPANMPIELMPISQRLNDLLTRLDASFTRERRYNADVAHELRTPLAGIRSILEVTLMRQRDIEEYKASISDCLEISKKMQTIVENLLTLARLDGKQVALRYESIGLKKLIDSIWQSYASKACEKKIIFENNVPDELTVNSDPDHLGIVISNLIDNSVEYTNISGLIRIEAQQLADSTKVAFENTGCKLAEEDLARAFDCFWRDDSSRTNTGTHCGLGLALVQRIFKILGGSCSIRTNGDGIFTLELSFPRK